MTNLLAQIEAARDRPVARLLTALGIPLVGPTVAKTLVRRFRSIEALRAATTEELEAIDGVGPEIVASLQAWSNDPETGRLIAKLAVGGSAAGRSRARGRCRRFAGRNHAGDHRYAHHLQSR